jgi:hypothetical protein
MRMANRERIEIKTSEIVKKQLKSRAEMIVKTLSQYLIDAGLASNHSTTKTDLFKNINSQFDTINADISYLKQMLFVNTKLLMMVLNSHYNDKEIVKNLYEKALKEAEKLFDEVE